MAIWAEITRSVSAFRNLLRRGRDTRLDEIASHTFEDTAISDGTLLEDVKFNPDLTETVFTPINRNTATFANENRN